MPEKTTKSGRSYTVDGKQLVWTTEDGTEVAIPLRIKLKVLRSMAHEDLENVATMFALIEQIVPGQADTLDEMDVNDFTAMFNAWNDEYAALSGASLGE
jgi:hypothetical protein